MMTLCLFRGACIAVAAAGVLGASASADTVLYSNGFESNTAGWSAGTTIQSSGTLGVPSAAGAFHARVGTNNTNFGGYNFGAGNAVPTVFQPYKTSLAIYLNVGGSAANDTRFDYTSAINNASGIHLSDFAFNVGFYNDESAGNRFVVSASNNTGRANSFPKNPGRNPVSISSTGWYTFEHRFYDNAGVLAVDMTILSSSNATIGSWTLSNPGHMLAGVGGNRYGWFASNEFSGGLNVDSSSLSVATVVPLPPAAWAGLSTMAGIAGFGIIRRRRHSA